ncbi:MAG: LPS-assembly protein LptD [Bacteroidales bacterium]|nr:LPS-assembly protein LptD [Bacteroidales bacterium]
MKKTLFILFILVLTATTVFGQRRASRDSLRRAHRMEETMKADSLPTDSLGVAVDSLELNKPKKPKSIVDTPIEYECSDSLMVSFDDKQVFLYGKSDVQTEGMSLKADHISMDMDKNTVFAEGKVDTTTNEIEGKPEFKDGKDEFTAITIKYNVKTKEGIVRDVNTEQQNGYIFGGLTKMHSNNEIHLKNGRYTTCDLDHPHFYLQLTRAKIIPNDKIVSGPVYFVFLDVPVFVLGLPFALFPSTKKHQSGIIVPKYGEESRRGFYLSDGGYYFAFSDYADLELLGSIYSYGSWSARASSKFKLRYKFSGNFDFLFSKNVQGEKEFQISNNPDISYSSTNSYKLSLNFTQDPKANPTSTFNVGISYDKSNYDRYNARSVQDYAKSSTQSSISYQKRLFGGKANLSMSANMTQNLYDSTISFSSAPTIRLDVPTFYPFKRKTQTGAAKWYEKINTNLNVNFSNRVPLIKDSLLFKQEMYDKMQYGLQYDIPLSTSAFNLFKYIQISPSVRYSGRVYPNYMLKYADGYDAATDRYTYKTDTINAIRHCFDFSTSISASTKLYGIFQFNKAKHIKAFRHVMSPSVGLSWRPDFSEEFWGFYRNDPADTTGTRKYSIFQNGMYGTPAAGKSAAITFGLGNNFEMKIKGKKDTIEGQYTKIKILENLNFSGSYNMAADSMKLSTISMSGSTRLFDKMTLSFGGTFDPYQLDSAGRRTKFYLFKETQGRQWARLTSFHASTGFSLDSKRLGKKKMDEKENAARKFGDDETQAEVDEDGNIITTAEEVEDDNKRKKSLISKKEKDGEFDYYSVPWNISVNYSFNYNKNGLKSTISQSLNLTGSITFTEKWQMSISSGYDFDAKKMTSTRLSVSRDLHCFNLSFYIIPFGRLKSYNFTLAINSSMFQGLDFKRNQSWRDN